MMVLPEELPHAAASLQHDAPDSSCSSSSASLAAATYSSESENLVESSRAKEEEREVPVKSKRQRMEEETGYVTPLYQQSLIDLSSKLGEIKRRQRRLRLQATISP